MRTETTKKSIKREQSPRRTLPEQVRSRCASSSSLSESILQLIRGRGQIVPPTAPKVGDRFDTLGEAYVAFAVANILHFGKSVTRSGPCNLSAGMLYCYRRPSLGEYCPFRVVLGRNEDNTHSAVLKSSTPYHNHGPRPELLADPSWRPTLRCKLVLAALAKLNGEQQKVSRDFVPLSRFAPRFDLTDNLHR